MKNIEKINDYDQMETKCLSTNYSEDSVFSSAFSSFSSSSSLVSFGRITTNGSAEPLGRANRSCSRCFSLSAGLSATSVSNRRKFRMILLCGNSYKHKVNLLSLQTRSTLHHNISRMRINSNVVLIFSYVYNKLLLPSTAFKFRVNEIYFYLYYSHLVLDFNF